MTKKSQYSCTWDSQVIFVFKLSGSCSICCTCATICYCLIFFNASHCPGYETSSHSQQYDWFVAWIAGTGLKKVVIVLCWWACVVVLFSFLRILHMPETKIVSLFLLSNIYFILIYCSQRPFWVNISFFLSSSTSPSVLWVLEDQSQAMLVLIFHYLVWWAKALVPHP